MFSIPTLVILITVLTSVAGFRDQSLQSKLIFYPKAMNTPDSYYRMLSSGFIHADWNHLIFNMLSLYFFADIAVTILDINTFNGNIMFILLYLIGIIFANLPAMLKHKDNSYYAALGASGGVTAVLFFTIYYMPYASINIMFIPIGIYAIIYGILYIAYSFAMAKRNADNVGHDAHLAGALFGIIFAFVTDPSHGADFTNQILHPPFLH